MSRLTCRNGFRCYRRIVIEDGGSPDLARLAVPLVGSIEETDDRWLPFRLIDPAGEPVGCGVGLFS
jgi:hypothetical protein